MRKLKLIEHRNNNRHLDLLVDRKSYRFNGHCGNGSGSTRGLSRALVLFDCKIDNRLSRHPRHGETLYLMINLLDVRTRFSPLPVSQHDFLQMAVARK